MRALTGVWAGGSLAAALVVGAGGCRDRECPLEFTGDVDERADLAISRANEFRELMGLGAGVGHPLINDAAMAHAMYMEDVGFNTHPESPDERCFTGERADDRMEHAGYPRPPGVLVSEVLGSGFRFEPESAVQGWLGTVYHRTPFTMAGWIDVGFGHYGSYSAMTFVLSDPAGVDAHVIYPVDGQTEVPTSFSSNQETPDPAPDHSVVGYPITVTVSASFPVEDWDNPYDLELLEGSLVGPGGEDVAVLLGDPMGDEHLSHMVFMLPEEPLQGGSEYTAEIALQWTGGVKVLSSTFTTSSD